MLLLLIPLAAAEAPPALTAAAGQEALDALTGLVAGQTFTVEQPELAFEVGCWDAVGVRDLSLTIPLDALSLTLHEDYLTARLALGELRGEGWTLFTEAPAGDEGCLEIEADMEWITFTDGVIEADLKLVARDGALDVVLADRPRLSGTLDMDIEWAPEWSEQLGLDWDWFPDDFFLDLFHDSLLDLVVELAAERAPALLEDLAPELAFETSVGDFDLEARLAELDHDAQAITVTGELDLSWTGAASCTGGGAAADWGRDPGLDAGGEPVSFGAGEAFFNRLSERAWSQGLLCLDAEGVAAVLAAVAPEAAGWLEGFELSFALHDPPLLSLDGGAAQLDLTGLRLNLAAVQRGALEPLLSAELDLNLAAGLAVDPALSAVVLDLSSLRLNLDIKHSEHLLSDAPGAEQELEQFIERTLPTLLGAGLETIALAPAVFEVRDLLVVQLTALTLEDGAASGGLALYAADDPALDRLAPEAGAELLEATSAGVRVALAASDDRPGPLAWSWRLDGGEWSPWALEEEVTVPAVTAGAHTLEVTARDQWWNEDASPWSASFDRSELPGEDPLALDRGGCSSAGGGAGWWWILGVVCLRRRLSLDLSEVGAVQDRLVRSGEHDLRDLPRLDEAAEGGQLAEGGQHLVAVAGAGAEHLGGGEARADADGVDTPAGEILAGRPHQPGERVLGGHIRRDPGDGLLGEGRADVQDAGAGQHPVDEQPVDPAGGDDVQLQGPPERGRVDLGGRVRRQHGGVVDDADDPGVRGLGCEEVPDDALGVGAEEVHAEVGDAGHRARAPGQSEHRPALLDKRLRARAADALAGAGDDGGPGHRVFSLVCRSHPLSMRALLSGGLPAYLARRNGPVSTP